MKTSIRSIIAAAAISVASLAGISAANAQAVVGVPPMIVDRLSPTNIPFIPGHVPSDCLAYKVIPGAAPVVYCENRPATPADIRVQLTFGGRKPWGARVDDWCVFRRDVLSGMGLTYCKPY